MIILFYIYTQHFGEECLIVEKGTQVKSFCSLSEPLNLDQRSSKQYNTGLY